ncbi:alpha beta-hydrolase [Physcia stellaris]|nr:alpha beta-hydrolase [Physcia stellaris]
MADDIEEFMQTHGLKRTILIGHSMTLALRSPKLVEALISVDNAPVDATLKSDFVKYVQGLQSIENAHPTKQIEADNILQKYEEALPIRQFLLTNLVRSSDAESLHIRIPIKILGASLDHMGDFPYKDPDETRYDGPTLFVRGTKSHYVADDVLPLIGRFFPRFEVKDIDCGHWVISEKPEPFRQAVVEFVQRHDFRQIECRWGSNTPR